MRSLLGCNASAYYRNYSHHGEHSRRASGDSPARAAVGIELPSLFAPSSSGIRERRNLRVTVREDTNRRPLDGRTDLHDYFATFDWGSDDDGASQLSLALLADALDNDVRAQSLHQKFKSRVIVDLPERWTMTRSRILAHAKMIERLELGR